MEDLEQTAAAIRVVESNDDYRYQQTVDIGGEPARRLGAYGIVDSRWRQLADAAGITGATWNDRAAQDRIAREKLTKAYEATGDWGMAAVSFRFGGQAANALTERGITDPASIDAAGYPDIANYLRALKQGQPQQDRPVSGRLTTPVQTQQKTNPTRRRADDIVRKQLYALRNAQRGGGNGSNEDIEQVADTDVPAGAE